MLAMRIPYNFWLTLIIFLSDWPEGARGGDVSSSPIMEIRSGRDLAIAFASSAHIDVAMVLADVWMLDTDWHGLLNSSEPILLSKDFTILGSPSLPRWPLINMGFVHGKIRIGNGITLTVRHVVVSDFRSDLLTQAPGFDLAAPTFPGNTSGILLHNETAVTYSVCLPKAIWTRGLNTSQRAASRPGVHSFELGVSQAGCVNITPSTITMPLLYPPSGGLALQPRLPDRCWADRGVFLDVAIPGADVAKAGRSTVQNNYDVVLINVTYMCASMMTLACMNQYRDPLACAISIVQNDTAPQPWRIPAVTEVAVRDGRQLAAVLAATPLVSHVIVEQDIWLHDSDWDGFLGGPYGSEPALISRDLVVAGDPRLASWPLVSLGFVHDKIRIASNVTITARHLLVADFRNEIPTQGPGVDLAAPTLLTATDVKPAVLLVKEAALLYALCFPIPAWNASLVTAWRATSSPGTQDFSLGVPQPNCVDVAPSTGFNSSGGIRQPPLNSRCWADRGVFIDVALPGAYVDQFENQHPTLYDVVLLNVSYLCANVMSGKCVEDHGDTIGCSSWMGNQLGKQVLPWQQDSVPSPAVQLHDGSNRSGGSDKSRAVMAGATGGAVGGTVLLALLAAILFVRHRSRQRCDDDHGSGKCSPQKIMDKRTGTAAAAAGAAAAMQPPGGDNGTLYIWKPNSAGNTGAAAAARTDTSTAATAKNGPVYGVTASASGAAGRGGVADGSASVSASASGEDDSGVAKPGRKGSKAARCSVPQDAAAAAVVVEAIRLTDSEVPALAQTGDCGGGGLEDLAGGGAIASTSDQTGDPLTRSGAPSSNTSAQRAPRPQNTAMLQPEDEHVVVTPLTPPRPDLAVGEAAAQEVTLLPFVRGKGAFGRVYEGLYDGERVAVKVMRDMGDIGAGGGGSVEHVRNSFVQEVEVLGRCQHPNVVRLLAACLTPPKLLLVMELMETSLEKLVYNKNGDLLPLRTLLYIALDIAKGLEYLHPTILHRDLKPGNVLINGANSSRPVAKLTDFGVSRLRSTVLITKHPEAGTPAYMAPETFDVKNYTLTHHVDMYSFGVLLWVLLTGEHPWRGFQMVEVAYKVTINRERLPAARIPPSRCPVRLRALMEQCWEYEPRRRPAAAEAAKEIQSLLESLST